MNWATTPPAEPGWYWLDSGTGPTVTLIERIDGVLWYTPGSDRATRVRVDDLPPTYRWTGAISLTGRSDGR